MKHIIMVVALLCCVTAMGATTISNSSNQASLQGYVTDAQGGDTLIGVTVALPELNIATTTDAKGHYSFKGLPQLTTTIQVSFLGHENITQQVNLAAAGRLDFVLKENSAMLKEVIVTGLTGKVLRKNSPTPVSVLTAREMQGTLSTNIIDAVAHEPGVAQVTTGTGISKPVIRGMGYNRVVVVNDGVRQEGQQWGDEHGIEIDPQSVSSVEILKGPASLMYGSDALAGVLIMHNDPVLSEGRLQANVVSQYQTNNGLLGYSLNMGGNQNGLVWDARYSQKLAHAYSNRYDGYVQNSQMREDAFNGLLGLNKSWGYSHLTFTYYHLKPGIVEGDRDEATGQFTRPAIAGGQEAEVIATSHDFHSYQPSLPYQHIHHYKAVLNNAFYLPKGSLRATVGYQRNRRQEYEDVLTPEQPGLDFLLHTVNYDVHYVSPQSQNWKIAAGINGMYQHSLNKGEECLVPAYNLFDLGIFATASYDLDRFHLSGGVRWDNRHLHAKALTEDDKTRFDDFARNMGAVSGSLGAIYNINEKMNLRINVARGFRAPNISELGSNGVHEGTLRYERGNQDLKPEFSWQFDLGFDYSSALVSAQLSLFANRIENYIFAHRLTQADGQAVLTDGYETFQYSAGNARLMGGEAVVDLHPVPKLHFSNSFAMVNAVQLHQHGQFRHLPYIPAHRWISQIKYDIVHDGRYISNTYAAIEIDCNFKQNHFYGAYGTETATPAYTLLNASAGTDILWKGRRVASVYITGSNLTNKAYQSHLSRLKYADKNQATGRTGVYNMGRNIGFKLVVPIDIK